MNEFASAAMVRVLVQGMHELGMQAPTLPVAAGAPAATVDLDVKRGVVMAAMQQGGLACLPLLGRGLHRYANEPTHRALVSARDPADLFERWGRLERYIHSHHRVQVIGLSAGGATLRHAAMGGRPAPLAVEDLVVLGVLAALLEAVGCRQVQATAGCAPAYPRPDAGRLTQAAASGQTDLWSWRWAWHGPAVDADPRQAAQGAEAGPPIDTLVAAEPWPDLAKRAFGHMAARLASPLTVGDLASALGTSPRTLQRELQGAGLSCRKLLAEARGRCAAWWLLHTSVSIAEIGYLSGYADQPHFTRDYKARFGMTPRAYRGDFAAHGPQAVAASHP